MENKNLSLTEREIELLSDDELVVLAQHGNEDAVTALIVRYKPLIKLLTRKYFIYRGVDNDDLVQEATLAFIKAVRHHDVNKGSQFKSFAFQCIGNRLRDVVRVNHTINNEGFNASVSLTDLDGNESEKITDASVVDPLDQAISNEVVEKIITIAKEELPKKQYDVLMLFLEGYSYQEIMEKLTLKNTKQVDNALAAARRTLRDLLSE
ncbi:MAG: sigma-70 family RNA polymerase sigma factor [Clostridia bacterium]|nr:sigma-70 family RNA polymerase sigma factor [Clostridia bacterium]